MYKKGSGWIWISVVLMLFLVFGAFFYLSLASPDYDKTYREMAGKGELLNPASGLSEQDAVAAFNESFVYYMLVAIKTYNLHNPPLSSETPKIELLVDSNAFNAEVKNGVIEVGQGPIVNEDVVIKTTAEEAVKMMNDRDYTSSSFRDGKSSIELIAEKSTLFAKGYLGLYNELTGESVTGGVIRIYFNLAFPIFV